MTQNCKNVDIVFIHPPSVYDFRKLNRITGSIDESSTSSDVFECIPLGFITMASFLNEKHYKWSKTG